MAFWQKVRFRLANSGEVGKNDFDMSGFDAILTKRTALGFFWLALAGFFGNDGGGRKRKCSSASIPAKTTQPKPFGFLQAPVPSLLTPAPFEAVETITHETLGNCSLLVPLLFLPIPLTFTPPTSQPTGSSISLHCFPAPTIR